MKEKEIKKPSTVPFPFATEEQQDEERWQMFALGSLNDPPEPRDGNNAKNDNQS